MCVVVGGELHVECFNADFLGECPEGAQPAVQKLAPILDIRFPNGTKPKIVMTGKGKGFFHGFTNEIIDEHKAGLHSVGLRAFMGDDARRQCGDLQDLMLHEIAVAWICAKMLLSCPARAWEETREQYIARLKACAADINATCDVERLCRAFPKRVQAVLDAKGGRIAP